MASFPLNMPNKLKCMLSQWKFDKVWRAQAMLYRTQMDYRPLKYQGFFGGWGMVLIIFFVQTDTLQMFIVSFLFQI